MKSVPSDFNNRTRICAVGFIALLCLVQGNGAESASTPSSASEPAKRTAPKGLGDDDSTFAAAELTTSVDTIKKDKKEEVDPKTTPERKAQLQIEQKVLTARRDEAAAKFPDSLDVQKAAAAAAVQAGDSNKGLAYADRAVALAQAKGDASSVADAMTTRAIGEYWSGDYPRAAADSAEVLKTRPTDGNMLFIYHAAKDRKHPSAGGATSADPGAPDLGAALSAAAPSPLDDPRVKAAARRALDRGEAVRRLNEAQRLLSVNDPSGALEMARRAQAADPTLADVYMQQAVALSILKDLAEALVQVTRAIGLWTAQGRAKELPTAYATRAVLENQLQKPDAAAEDADRALAYDPRLARAYVERAKAREALGGKADAILADFEKAAALQPDFHDEYEQALKRLGGGAAAAAAPAGGSARDGWLDRLVLLAGGLLAALIGYVALLWRRGRKKSRAEGRRSLNAQYDIEEQIGEGGMGAVYKGWDKALKRPVAIKRLRAELQRTPRERERFIKEAELVASLHHPHIVEIYTILRDEEDTHLVFEYIVGRTVHELLNESSGRHLPASQALSLLQQIAKAVDHAHERRVIHRDLKPANIMIADGGWVKVMDFGIARQVQDSLLTTTNTIVGTPTYMAPEQSLGAVVRESDVFSLGVTLYEMLTGGLPFKGADETRDKLSGRFTAPSLLVPDLPRAIDAVLAKALAPRAEERYHSCLELYRAAAEALEGRATPAAP